MRVRRISPGEPNAGSIELLDNEDKPIPIVSGFLHHLQARGYSPNTLLAYAYDLAYFMRFLADQNLPYGDFHPPHALAFLEYLQAIPTRKPAQRQGVVLCTTDGQGSARTLAPSTINRILAAVSSFYEYLILSGQLTGHENPIQKESDPQQTRVRDRHRSFLDGSVRQKPIRRVVRVKTPLRLPRPLSDEHIQQLLGSLRTWRDKAMILGFNPARPETM